MKLYTEEQVIQAFKSGMNACMKHKDWALAINYPNKIELLEYMQSLTPIEIPSDEEIEKELFYQKQVMNPYSTEEYAYTAYEKGFMEAAEWMRNKIQGGNNEQ